MFFRPSICVLIRSAFMSHNWIQEISLGFLVTLKVATQRCALPAGGRDETTRFDGTNLKPRKLPENAATPTSRVHAVLGNLTERQTRFLQKDNIAILTKFYNELQLWQPTKRTRLT